MKEVASKVFHIFLRPLARKGVPLEHMLAGTSVSVASLRSKSGRLDWAELCTIHENLRAYFTDAELVELGRSLFRPPALRFMFLIGRLLLTPMGFYRWLNTPRKGAGNQLFLCVAPHHREISDHECEIELTLPEGYPVCWDFFLITRGSFEEAPRLFGYANAEVALERIPQGGRFHVTIPKRTRLLTRLRRAVTWPFAARAAARELRDANETLVERYEELEDARAKIDRQARQLQTAHAINELVQRDLDLARTLDTIATALVEQAGFASAEIRLTGGQHAACGEPAGEPIVRALHARGGETQGELRITAGDAADLRERDELLAFVMPSLAMAVENATYRHQLEQLVDQRTTELRQARDELAGTVAKLEEAQGVRERFFGNISHEFRTPLTIITLAASDVAYRAGALIDGRSRQNLDAIDDAAHKLVRLVDELLLLAAGQEGKLRLHPEPTDLAELLRQLATAWRAPVETAGLTLVTRVPETLIASVDPVAIERVASNLISNAVKYTPAGGSIELELAEEPGGLRLSVLDTGPGIAEDLVGRLFGRFERAAGDPRKGTGIGLSLAKQLVEAHGGTIEAIPRGSAAPPATDRISGFGPAATERARESAVPKATDRARESAAPATTSGSELRIGLPASLLLPTTAERAPVRLRVVETLPAPVVVAAAEHGPEGPSHGTILLAEDDVQLADLVARTLADDYTVVVAHDGHAALEIARLRQPQLLITDVDMPGLDGVELSRRFRELAGDQLAPIIILSAVLDLGTRLAGLDAGAIDYVTKPFDPLELRARVRAQLRMRDLATRLHRAEQISSLGILTSGLAHELRNPANAIVNAIAPLQQLLPAELKQPEHVAAQLLEVIEDCAGQVAALSKQLLGFRSKGGELDVRDVSLEDLVQRAITFVQGALSGVDVRVDVRVPVIRCAPPLMIQVLTNLIENAGHAAGRGGWVEVRATRHDSCVRVEISDSGPGVPAPLRERVFEPFFTTKATSGGTGLGLSLARDIVLRHHGVLEIRDRGSASSFVIELADVSRPAAVDAL